MFKDMHEYIDLIDKIENCLNWFKRKDIDYNRYKMYLSNGEMIEIDYNLNCLPHLLGIDTNFLRSTGLFKGKAIDILESIIDDSNFLYNQFKNGHISQNQVFSKYIDKKSNNFYNICEINIFDIEFIAKYESSNSYISGNQKLDGDYYIAYKKDDLISIMGLKLNDNRLYQPITNLEFDKYSEEYDKFLKQLLPHQSLTCVRILNKNSINPDGTIERKKFYYNTKDKITKIKKLDRYAENYNCHVTTNTDNIFYITKVDNLYDEKNKLFEILSIITEAINSKSFIDAIKLETKYENLGESLLNLISAHNNSLSKSSDDSDNSDNQENNYKNLILELKNLREKITNQETLIAKLNNENQKLKEKNQQLQEKNQTLEEKEQKIRNILG